MLTYLLGYLLLSSVVFHILLVQKIVKYFIFRSKMKRFTVGSGAVSTAHAAVPPDPEEADQALEMFQQLLSQYADQNSK